MKLEIKNAKKAWGEHLQENNFKNGGRMFDKYGKKYDTHEKDGKTYTASATIPDENGTIIITLKDVSDVQLFSTPPRRR